MSRDIDLGIEVDHAWLADWGWVYAIWDDGKHRASGRTVAEVRGKVLATRAG